MFILQYCSVDHITWKFSRKWSLKTGKCLKIYTGHGDAVCCLGNHGDVLVSGSYDKSCRGDKLP